MAWLTTSQVEGLILHVNFHVPWSAQTSSNVILGGSGGIFLNYSNIRINRLISLPNIAGLLSINWRWMDKTDWVRRNLPCLSDLGHLSFSAFSLEAKHWFSLGVDSTGFLTISYGTDSLVLRPLDAVVTKLSAYLGRRLTEHILGHLYMQLCKPIPCILQMGV